MKHLGHITPDDVEGCVGMAAAETDGPQLLDTDALRVEGLLGRSPSARGAENVGKGTRAHLPTSFAMMCIRLRGTYLPRPIHHARDVTVMFDTSLAKKKWSGNKDGYIENTVNSRFYVSKKIRKSEATIVKMEKQSWSSYWVSSAKRDLKRLSEWASEFKLVKEGSIIGMPCSACPRAFHGIEGNCGFGGSFCDHNLSKALK